MDDKAGTKAFNAPEMFSECSYLAKPLDVWSYAITVYLYLTRKLPFDHRTADDEFGKTLIDLDFNGVVDTQLAEFSEDLRSLLK